MKHLKLFESFDELYEPYDFNQDTEGFGNWLAFTRKNKSISELDKKKIMDKFGFEAPKKGSGHSRPRMEYRPLPKVRFSICVYEGDDSWWYVTIELQEYGHSSGIQMYKCDDWEGLMKCIQDKVIDCNMATLTRNDIETAGNLYEGKSNKKYNKRDPRLVESFKFEPLIYKIPGIALTTLGYKKGKDGGTDWSWLAISDKYKSYISDIFKDIDFELVELNNQHQWLTLHFTKPKRFEKCQVSMHVYNPADVYYTIRISMFDDDWFSFNWFGQVYATQEHMLNHYKKYPHFGPGGKMHTFTDREGEERLSYQPVMYTGFDSYVADSFGANDRKDYLCDQFDSLETLLIQFRDFLLDDNTLRFETNYPNWDQEQLRFEEL